METWFVGQQIVCVKVDGYDGEPVAPQVSQFLKLGDVYEIREIVPDYLYYHKKKGQKLCGFRLKGIFPEPGLDQTNIYREYAFFEGRFEPLKEIVEDRAVGIPQSLKDALDQVNKGLVKFDDEFEQEIKKEKQKETEPALV